jgi:hypothetical protein|tara:strand:+ start:18022 stop:20205 length:2184 start_codon:yes stop_codon:yes gene_type:complete
MKESNLKHKNTLKFGHSDDETTKKTGDTGSKRKESLRTRKSSTRVKPTKQTTRQFINLLLESSSEISNIYRKVEEHLAVKHYTKQKQTEIGKSWAQNMVEQIILFYKVVIFHQNGLRMVLELINTIASASDDKIDEIVMRLKEQTKNDKGPRNAKTLDEEEDPIGKGVLEETETKWKQETRAKASLMDSEEREQSARRVRALISSKRVRLLYFLLYNRYRVTTNEIVRIKKRHPLKKFLEHFNKFIDNKLREFIKTPIQEKPKDEAKEIGQMRKDLIEYGGENMNDWEKMYLMSVLMNKGKAPGMVATSGGLLTNFGSVKDLDEEFENLQREIYEFTSERLLLILFEQGFKLDYKSLKTFVDEYSIITEREETERDRTTNERSEDYITQMQTLTRIMKGGLFKRPVMEYKGGEKVYEYILRDAYVTRPLQILKEVPDYPEYLRRLHESFDKKTWIAKKCGKANTSCMPELSIGRVMYFIMSHLVMIHRILQRLATERLTAASSSLKFTKRKKVTDALFQFNSNSSVPSPFNPNSRINATNTPIYDTDLYTMAILDSEEWNLGQKSDNDVLVGFIEPQVLRKFRYSVKDDPHDEAEEKRGLIPNMLDYNDLENLLYRVFWNYDKLNKRLEEYEKVFLSLNLSRWGIISKGLRKKMVIPMRSVSQKIRYLKAKQRTRNFIESVKFGILRNKVNKYGLTQTIKYFSDLNKQLSDSQKQKNKQYLSRLLKN